MWLTGVMVAAALQATCCAAPGVQAPSADAQRGVGSEPATGTRPATALSRTDAIPGGLELAGWIEQLDADVYEARAAATAKLAELPAGALSAVKEALAAKPLAPEAEARATVILRALERKAGIVMPGLTNAKMKFDFEAVPVDTIIARMSQEYGFIVIQTQPIRQAISVRNPQPLDAKAGVILLNDMLFQLGYTTVVDTTPDWHTALRIMSLQEAKKLQIPVFAGANPDEIPLDDSLRTQIIPLQNVSALAVRNALIPLMVPDVDVTSGVASNSLVITDTSAKINRLVQIIQKLDQANVAPLMLEYKQLQHANAADAARLVNQKFSPQDAGQGRGPGGNAGGGGGGAMVGRMYADYDARTNTVVLNGPPDQVAQAIADLDLLDAQAASQPPGPASKGPAPVKPNAGAKPE